MISLQRDIGSETTTWPILGYTLSPTSTPVPSTARGWSSADPTPGARWMIGDDSELLDRIYRLRRATSESATRGMNDVWTGIGSSPVPLKIVGFTAPTDDLYPNLREALHDLDQAEDEGREERFPAPLPPALLNVYRQLHAFNAGSSAFPLETVDFTALAGGRYPDLCDALRDLEGVRNEAREEGFPVPSDTAFGNAGRLLHAMYRILPRRFEVYPMPDGEIAIDVPGRPGRSVLLLCGSDGGALCSVNMDGAHRRARYSDTHGLPDGFVRDALAELERSDSAAA